MITEHARHPRRHGAAKKLWFEEGDESILRPYEGELESESDQLPEKLEQLFSEENKKY